MLFGPQPDRPTWAITLVHGIGTTKPLDMITEVSRAIKGTVDQPGSRPDFELSEKAEVYEVSETAVEPDGTQDGKKKPLRYVHVRNGTIDGGKVRIGTAHWADVSYYREGIISLIGILLMAAFGVRFFANVATAHRPGTPIVIRIFSGVVRFLLTAMILVLAVFIFPVTFVSLIFSTFGLIAEYTIRYWGALTTTLQIAMIAGGGFAVSVGLAYIGIKRIASMQKERSLGLWIFGSMILISCLLAAAMVASLWLPRIPDYLRVVLLDFAADWIKHGYLPVRIEISDRIGVFFVLMHILQLILGILMLILTSLVSVTLLLYAALSWAIGRSSNTIIFAVVSVVSIWIAMSLLLWPENLANHSALARFVKQDVASRIACVPVDVLTDVEEFSVSGLTKWAVSERTQKSIYIGEPTTGMAKCPATCRDGKACPPIWTHNDRPDGVRRTLEDTYPVSWFETAYLTFLFACVIVFAIVYTARKLWLWTLNVNRLDAYAPADGKARPRRSNWPRLIVSTFYTFVVLFFTFGVSAYFLWRLVSAVSSLYGGTDTPAEVTIGAEMVRLAAILFVSAFVVFSTYTANGLKLVLDVVNHFTQPAQSYPVRNRIEKRFEEMVEYLIAPCTKPHLVIIAHSQGTVITIDALMNDNWVKATLQRVSSLTIVTVGSPFTHVYQTYFPREYPKLKERLVELSSQQNVRWINAYRIDDYVGTYIENSIPRFPINVPLPPGGHLRYWEKDVIQRVLATPEIKNVLFNSAEV